MKLKYIILIILLILFVIFIFQNISLVTVSFLVFHITMPRSIMLILTLIVGIFIGNFLPYRFKKQR